MLIPLQLASDARVVRRVLAGRRDEFGVLVERYYRAVESVARARLAESVDAEDVAQETFLRAYLKLDTLAEREKFGPWLMAIARNAAVSYIRRRKGEVLAGDVAAVAQPAAEPGVERAELQRLVRAKLDEMAPEQREILMLFYYGDKSVSEIAALLQISKDAANKRLQRARAALGAEFLKSIGEPARPRDAKRARRAVMAAIASTPVAWQAKAAAGMASVAAVKGTVGLLAVVLLVAGVWLGVKHARPQPAQPAAARQVAQTVAPAKPDIPAEEPKPTAPVQRKQTGPCRLDILLLDANTEQPVGNAEVTAELVTWTAREMPPGKTVKKTGRADQYGEMALQNLPKGTWSVLAVTATRFGVSDYTFGSNPEGLLRVWMRPRTTAWGRVVEPDDAPVPGAVVYPYQHILMPNDKLGLSEVALLRAVTNAEGRFDFPLIVPGSYRFYVLAESFPPTITGFYPLGEEMLIRLGGPGSIAGRVVDADTGQGVGGVVVRACAGDITALSMAAGAEYGWRIAVEDETGPDGAFRLAGLAPGKYKIEVDDAALLNRSPDAEFEVKPGEETKAEIKVSVGGTVLGRVYNAETGEGMPGMGIRVQRSATAITETNGEYMITRLTPGSHMLSVEYPTGDNSAPWRFSGDASTFRSISVTYSQVLQGVDFAVKPATTLTGRVVDNSGAPVAGASVYIRDGRGGSEMETSADGTFSDVVFPVDNLTLWAKKDGWQSEQVMPSDISREVVLMLNVPADGSIQGRVLSADGKPLVYHDVRAFPANESDTPRWWPGVESRTGGRGDFLLEHLPPGTYELHARAATPNCPLVANTRVRLGKGQALQNVILRQESSGTMTISGRVTTSDGGDLMNAEAAVPWGQSVKIGPDGRFEFKGLEDGIYKLFFSVAGYSPTTVSDVPAGTQNLNVELRRPAVLAGAVTDAVTGRPIEVFVVRAQVLQDFGSDGSGTVNNISLMLGQTVTNGEGRFEFENFATGPVSLQVGAEGYVPRHMNVTLAEGQNEIPVRLEPAAAVHGTVTDTAGNPIIGAGICCLNELQFSIMRNFAARTDENGEFELNVLPEGASLQLAAVAAGYAYDCVEVTLAREKPAEVAFVLQPAGALDVRVLVDGEPTVHCYVEALLGCVTERIQYDVEKGLVVEGLPPGEAEFTAVAGEGRQTFRATVVPGQTTVVEVRFDAGETDEAG